jgi:AAA family ATP:ADP antiporter
MMVDVRPGELAAMLTGAAYFFFLLSGYFILRPIRDEIGVDAGVARLPWLFTGTLIATLVLNPLFSTLVAKLRVRTFIPITYTFFIANLLVFYLLLRLRLEGEHRVWLGYAFFIWTSVFNLFVVSVFWAFMADTFRSEQAKRLYGFIGVGGTFGAIVGAAITTFLVRLVGSTNLLLVSASLLAMAVLCVIFFPGRFRTSDGVAALPAARGTARDRPIGGSSFAGILGVLRSPYLLGICAFMLLFTIGSTVLYFHAAEILGAQFQDREERTAFLASVDLAVNTLTILAQLFLTGRVLKWFGVGPALAFVPALSIVGFLALGFAPTLAVLAVFQVMRRAGEFAFTRPAREVLYTVVSREDKYKAKNLIDTFVYRGGDQVGAWSYRGLAALGLTASGIAFAAVPLAIVWIGVAVYLGRRQRRMEAATTTAAAVAGAEVAA